MGCWWYLIAVEVKARLLLLILVPRVVGDDNLLQGTVMVHRIKDATCTASRLMTAA
jgi:hypothetical protein